MTLDLERLKELHTVTVCAGPPHCAFEGSEAAQNAVDGCTICTRIAIDEDGNEIHYRLPAH